MPSSSNSSEIEDFVEKNQNFDESKQQVSSALFSDIISSDILLENIRNAGFENPSPVQSIAIPKVLLGQDLLCQAKSGTGKTAVFVLSIAQLLYDILQKEKSTGVLYIVIANTQEMSEQIKSEFIRFSKNLNINIGDCKSQYDVDVLIGTPEEIFYCLKNGLNVSNLCGIVIDECDYIILNSELKNFLISIFNIINKPIQTMMFTATLTKASKEECLKFLKNPFLIFVDDDDSKLTLHGLKQYYIETKERDKLDLLKKLTKKYKQIIVFTKYIQNTLYIENNCESARAVTQLMDIKDRLRALEDFKNSKFNVLATTDILSRGIDIQSVDCVINYDIPADPQTYLHRVGRAGRFETEGYAINFANGIVDGVRMNEIMDRYEINIEKIDFNE